jgi:type I restriction enzyme R subunit
VTVDLIATGTDIKPVEIVVFMRSVKSRVLFEQMKGRGVRVINVDELRAVTPDAKAKTRFLIVDCVGVTEHTLSDTRPLEKNPAVSLRALLDHVAANGVNDDYLSSLASRLARIDKQCDADDRKRVADIAGGASLAEIAAGLVQALDGDVQEDAARRMFQLPPDVVPSDEQLRKAAVPLKKAAIQTLMATPALRKLVLELRDQFEQVVDDISKDELIASATGYSKEAKEKAALLVKSFEEYLAEHKDEIDALQFFYSVPHAKRLRYADIKRLADGISSPPRQWTPEKLWRAYETLEASKVRGASAGRLLTDVVSLVRFALHQENELAPHVERVNERFERWMAQQANKGRAFTPDQRRWLEMMRDHIGTSLEVELDDFDLMPFTSEGGLAKATKLFGKELGALVRELNEALVA